MKMICYCADDYALNSQISHAVRTLLQKNAIQATSCMAQSPIWKEQSHELLKLKTEIEKYEADTEQMTKSYDRLLASIDVLYL